MDVIKPFVPLLLILALMLAGGAVIIAGGAALIHRDRREGVFSRVLAWGLGVVLLIVGLLVVLLFIPPIRGFLELFIDFEIWHL